MNALIFGLLANKDEDYERVGRTDGSSSAAAEGPKVRVEPNCRTGISK